MTKRFWSALVVLTCAATTRAGEEPPSKLFGLTRVHEFHLDVAAAAWPKIQPAGGGFPGFPGGRPGAPGAPGATPAKPAEKSSDVHKGSGFGVDFPFIAADFTALGHSYKHIGLRYKGNASYMASSGGLKRNFKIELDHFDGEERVDGEKKINLNAGAMDPGRLREALSYSVFRAAGVPAPRTAFATLTLTVPGKYDKEFVGLYTVVEQVDKTFLKNHFNNNKGMLLKPERVRGIEYLGDDWSKYNDRYRPKHEPTVQQAARFIEFAKLVNKGTDEEFAKRISSILDTESFLRFLAVQGLIVNHDSPLGLEHNFYLYLNPNDNKFVFIPWDLDLSLGNFGPGGGGDKTNLSVEHPHMGEKKLIDRVLAVKPLKERYQQILKELSDGCFSKAKLLKDLDDLEKVTKEPLAKEKKAIAARKERTGFGFGPPGGGFGASPDLRTFLENRADSVVAQLSGKSKGVVMSGGFFGPPGGPGGGPGGGRGGPGGGMMAGFFAPPVLHHLDTDKDGKVSQDEFVTAVKKFFKDCDKEDKGSINEKQIADGLSALFPPPPPGFGPPPGGSPGRFSPGAMMAGPIVQRADANKDGRITQTELLAAAETLFKEADQRKIGKLDQAGVSAAMELLFPARGPGRGFGPGGPPRLPKD
jgi:spore coat protein H